MHEHVIVPATHDPAPSHVNSPGVAVGQSSSPALHSG